MASSPGRRSTGVRRADRLERAHDAFLQGSFVLALAFAGWVWFSLRLPPLQNLSPFGTFLAGSFVTAVIVGGLASLLYGINRFMKETIAAARGPVDAPHPADATAPEDPRAAPREGGP